MRITGGHVRGRQLASLKGLAIRPTSDRVRESIFDLIGHDATGLKVLDLFAGTGSLGIEALSRGALWAIFVDHSIQSVKLIKKNLLLTGYEASGFILKKGLIRGLPLKYPLMKNKIDLVFIDPPYGKKLIPPLLMELADKKILATPSIVVAESSKTDILPDASGKLILSKSKIYGDTKIDIYFWR